MVTKTKKAKTKKRTNDPRSLKAALRWYLAPGKARSLRQTVAKFRNVSFERLRRAAKGKRRRRRSA